MTAATALRLLLVDDDIVDRMAVLRALRKLFPPPLVQECASAKAALEQLALASFDCVISDFEMPGDNGLWLLEQIKGRGIDVPVVILTGQGDEQTAVTLMKAGALDYVPKGSDIGDLVGQVVQRAVRLHRSERAARLARERLALTLEVTGVGTWDYDLVADRVLLDPSSQALLELDGDSLTLPDGLAFVSAEDNDLVRERLKQALSDPAQPHFHSEHRCVKARTKRPVWIGVTGRVFWEGERAVRMLGTLADISVRKEEELLAQRRMEFEQQLIGIVSHDLRNPIAAMTLGASLIADQTEGQPVIGNAAQRVLASGQRASRLIRDLLDFTQARLGRGLPIAPQKSDFQHVCKQVVDELTLAHPERTIEHHCDSVGECVWDVDRVAQALSNLLRNALSYSPPETNVRVWTRRDNDEVTIAVHNENLQGPIPAELQATLFEPFRRGDRKHDPDRSIGLGLYIVREVVRAHGGSVEVRSTEADGTTFSMRLPCVAQAEGSSEIDLGA